VGENGLFDPHWQSIKRQGDEFAASDYPNDFGVARWLGPAAQVAMLLSQRASIATVGRKRPGGTLAIELSERQLQDRHAEKSQKRSIAK